MRDWYLFLHSYWARAQLIHVLPPPWRLSDDSPARGPPCLYFSLQLLRQLRGRYHFWPILMRRRLLRRLIATAVSLAMVPATAFRHAWQDTHHSRSAQLLPRDPGSFLGLFLCQANHLRWASKIFFLSRVSSLTYHHRYPGSKWSTNRPAQPDVLQPWQWTLEESAWPSRKTKLGVGTHIENAGEACARIYICVCTKYVDFPP